MMKIETEKKYVNDLSYCIRDKIKEDQRVFARYQTRLSSDCKNKGRDYPLIQSFLADHPFCDSGSSFLEGVPWRLSSP